MKDYLIPIIALESPIQISTHVNLVGEDSRGGLGLFNRFTINQDTLKPFYELLGEKTSKNLVSTVTDYLVSLSTPNALIKYFEFKHTIEKNLLTIPFLISLEDNNELIFLFDF